MAILDQASSMNLKGCNIFVDTNVLLFVDGAVAFGEREKKYSDLYFSLKKNNNLFTSEKCLGEFSNKLVKFHYNMERESNANIADFKRYRKSGAFASAMECIFNATCEFFTDMNVLSDYSQLDFQDVFRGVQTGLIDYCDLISARLCLKDNFYFFTDDGDAFNCKDLNIITLNSWMIKNSTNHAKLASL